MGHNMLLERVEHDALRAMLRFVFLVCVLLVLPNEELDILFGLNPQRIWLVVVFITGLSLLGYLLSKIVDPTTAIGLTGALGGCVSPGLTITSLAEQSRRYRDFAQVYAFAAGIAVTMLFPRNLIIVGIVSPSLALSLVVPFVAMASASLAVTGLLWTRTRVSNPPANELDTPFQIRSAFVFVAIIAVVLTLIDAFELSISSDVSRIGVVVITVIEIIAYTGVTWTAGVEKMARVIALILLVSASSGIGLVVLL